MFESYRKAITSGISLTHFMVAIKRCLTVLFILFQKQGGGLKTLLEEQKGRKAEETGTALLQHACEDWLRV